MIKYFILLISLLISHSIFSQDIIKTKDGRIIRCDIVNDDSIFYYFDFKVDEKILNSYINKKNVESIKSKKIKYTNYSTFNLENHDLFDKEHAMINISGCLGFPSIIGAKVGSQFFLLNSFFVGGSIEGHFFDGSKAFIIGPEMGITFSNSSFNFYFISGVKLSVFSEKYMTFSRDYNFISTTESNKKSTYIDFNIGLGFIIPFNENNGINVCGQLHRIKDYKGFVNLSIGYNYFFL